jgi:hypothetical protein
MTRAMHRLSLRPAARMLDRDCPMVGEPAHAISTKVWRTT